MSESEVISRAALTVRGLANCSPLSGAALAHARCLVGQLMESFWSEVGAVWPYDGACHRVEGHPGEVRRVPEWLEHRPVKQRRDIYRLLGAIIEDEFELVRTDHLSPYDMEYHVVLPSPEAESEPEAL